MKETVAMIVIMLVGSGCGALGVRNVDAWGFKMEFAEGIDVHAGVNAVDNVDNRRGVSRVERRESARKRLADNRY